MFKKGHFLKSFLNPFGLMWCKRCSFEILKVELIYKNDIVAVVECFGCSKQVWKSMNVIGFQCGEEKQSKVKQSSSKSQR